MRRHRFPVHGLVLALVLALVLLGSPAWGQIVGTPPAIPAGQIVNVSHFGAKCDGSTDDAAAFAAAVAAAPAGSTLFVPGGTCNTVVVLPKTLRLTGTPGTVLTRAGTADLVTVNNGAVDVQIDTLTLQGQAADATITQRGIFLTGSSLRTTIRQVVFTGSSASTGLNIAVHIDGSSSDNLVTGNTFSHLIGLATDSSGYSVLVETSVRNRILGNTSTQSATQGRHHIYLSAGASDNLVANNLFVSGVSDQVAIFAVEAQAACQNNRIVQNIFRDLAATADGIAALHITQKAFFNVAAGNTILGSGSHGIFVEASPVAGESHADDNDLIGNSIQGAGRFGIEIRGASRTTISGNVLTENGTSSAGGFPGIGISSNGAEAPASENRVLSNVASGATIQRAGLVIDSGAPAPSGTVVSHNTFPAGVVTDYADGGTGTVAGWNILSGVNTAGKGNTVVLDLKNTGFAAGKTVVCVDTATGLLYASTSDTACAN